MASETEAVNGEEAKPFFSSRNLFFICALSIADGADYQLLPSAFRALEADLGFTLDKLLLMQATQGVAMAVAGPLWASLVDNGARHSLLLAAGSMGWGVATILLAMIDTYWIALALRALAGVFLGSLLPVVQSMTAEDVDRTDRGRAFGLIDFSRLICGQTLTNVFVTGISNNTIMGMRGWRVGFIVVGGLSMVLSVLTLVFLKDRRRQWEPHKVGLFSELTKLFGYFRVPTFSIIIAQGMLGTIPWVALNLTTMYFQYSGMPDQRAGFAFSTCLVGNGVGSVFGGWLGDALTHWSPFHGRPAVAQTSVLLGMPVVVLMFHTLPAEAWTFYAQVFLCFTLGLVASWCSPGCNKPIFIDIVPEDSTASAVAWDNCIETGFAQITGNAAMSLVSGLFGYSRVASAEQVSSMTEKERLTNAHALGNSILFCMLTFWSLCFCLYGTLHWTYKRDYEDLHGAAGESKALLASKDKLPRSDMEVKQL
mmetsp:Transcript_11568/g.26911  ORF Transcript_11568/g.26911 Transcript_11568/m.26911 type:complete len:481 (-) Transcript_11568:203-1645(-)|eukprot:CAMPEP_0178421722 /NCGR_PEP_ID=MMETSP0689_2-20121128/26794_1 /TAXON_ID=160604 /ORGANISM="Amphidinium massartii, Strain CS-259" /LENGTH=480 /DNA_ID=CAMNT_0020043243 /DNA_START=33 /DNA_END=1475 /DNA_ORIENTATION=-